MNRKKKKMIRGRLYRKQKGRCFYCGQFMHEPEKVVEGDVSNLLATIDHVVPKSKGGGDVLHNMVVACMPCNSKKSDAIIKPQTYKELLEEMK